MSTHPIEHIEPVVGQVGPEQIDAPADAGPQARGEILRLRLALAKAQRRIATLEIILNEQNNVRVTLSTSAPGEETQP